MCPAEAAEADGEVRCSVVPHVVEVEPDGE